MFQFTPTGVRDRFAAVTTHPPVICVASTTRRVNGAPHGYY
jgi:hypothetical protein